MLVDVLAEASDFFSLGTNDLTQYTMAVDRGNAKVSGSVPAFASRRIALIRQTIEAGTREGSGWACAANWLACRNAIPILLGFGLDEFSMNPRAIPEAKHLIGKLTDEKAT